MAAKRVLVYWFQTGETSIFVSEQLVKLGVPLSKQKKGIITKITWPADNLKYQAKIIEVSANINELECITVDSKTGDIIHGSDISNASKRRKLHLEDEAKRSTAAVKQAIANANQKTADATPVYTTSSRTPRKQATPTKVVQMTELTNIVTEEKNEDYIEADVNIICKCDLCLAIRKDPEHSLVIVKAMMSALEDQDPEVDRSCIESLRKKLDFRERTALCALPPYKIPGHDKVQLVHKRDVYLPKCERRMAYLAAAGDAAALGRQLLKRIFSEEFLIGKTARGKGDHGIPPEVIDVVLICVNDYIKRKNEDLPDDEKQSFMSPRQWTKVTNTYLESLAEKTKKSTKAETRGHPSNKGSHSDMPLSETSTGSSKPSHKPCTVTSRESEERVEDVSVGDRRASPEPASLPRPQIHQEPSLESYPSHQPTFSSLLPDLHPSTNPNSDSQPYPPNPNSQTYPNLYSPPYSGQVLQPFSYPYHSSSHHPEFSSEPWSPLERSPNQRQPLTYPSAPHNPEPHPVWPPTPHSFSSSSRQNNMSSGPSTTLHSQGRLQNDNPPSTTESVQNTYVIL